MAEPAVPEKQADRRALSGEYAAFAQTDADGLHHLTLRVEGIHCAACIYAIESALSPLPDVKEARVNLSTRRLAITWEGDVAQADTFAQTVETLGYPVQPFDASRTPRMQEEEKLLLKAMAISGFAMGNIMLLSVALWSSDQAVMGVATRDLFHWITALIALPTIAYAGRPFFRSALMALRGGHTNMDVPISLALLLACGMSMVETLRPGEHAYFDSAVMLLFFLLIGRYLDARARGKARQNAQTLLDSMQGVAQVIEGETMRYLPIRELREGMQVRVAAGEKIPTDSRVLEGESEIDSSLMTGESTPAAVKPGDRVYGGTLNLHAPLLVEISKASEHSLLADIVRLMEKAEQGRARYVRLADRAARLYTPVVHSLALLTFLGWWLGMGIGWQPALLYAITVLIITCPCALGLAVPVVQVLASSWLMRRGILLKSGDALERLAIIDTAVFDKTGTLTQGKPVLVGEYADKD
ncbi:MAG: heavy metal translocating P-type ATPase, partial [Rickettsiales bacterium]